MVYRALVVDDNSVSVAVLSGLLKKYGIDTATAESGVAALEREDLTSFQLIFADYLMPEMNGLETLQKIKEKTQMQGKNIFMFLCTGNEEEVRKIQMEETVPILQKPVKKRQLEDILKECISLEMPDVAQSSDAQETIIIPGLDTAYALERFGDIGIYKEILKEYYRAIKGKSKVISEYAQEFDVEAFKIEVHGLKSASRLIGALDFAQFCERLEKECLDYSRENLLEKAEQFICRYESYLELLKPYGEVLPLGGNRQKADIEQVKQWLIEVKNALEDFDYDQSVAILSTMKQYVLPDVYENVVEKLQEKIDNIDYDGGIAIIDGVL